MRTSIVRVVRAASGTPTPHDGRYIVAWDSNVAAGTLAVTSIADPAKARRFRNGEEFVEWKAVSRIEPRRPWDGRPNRPLSALTVESIVVDDAGAVP